MLTYDQLILNRRSVRDFQSKTISNQIIQEILIDTCKAPSASNVQPWRFIIIQDKNLLQKLSSESKTNNLKCIQQNHECPLKRYEKTLQNPNFNVYYNAPCLILIVSDNKHKYFIKDCSLAAAYLMFAATARGLGTCWVGLGDNIQDPILKTEIGLPPNYEIVAPIILGYPVKIPTMLNRNEATILYSIGID